ncbi:hypothetical protein KAU18_09640 [Candidatus Bathyarchaeota archaeon]|nr:hypothetical protein [Candidatus Bathyarchaeota archaeon]
MEDDAVICAGAVLRPGITVGRGAVVGMGAVVTGDVPPESVVYGNPGRVRYGLETYREKKKIWESEP